MADPVKISELPVASSVAAGDILPVVDSGLTQTRRCTAAQIAQIGGGPPGAGSVVTDSLASGAVTAPKVGFTGPDKLISRTLSGAGAGVEIPCTSYARGLLAASDASGARAYLDALQSSVNPTFDGTVSVNGNVAATGTVSATGGVNTGNVNGATALSLSSGGTERFRVFSDGNFGARVASSAVVASNYENTGLYPAFMCRAGQRQRNVSAAS
jgi:hypothetical protein